MAVAGFELFIFDLDGTLVDSRRDIATALNGALTELGLSALSIEQVSRFIGDGMSMLVERALRESSRQAPSEELFKRALAVFREQYGKHLLDTTRLLEGVPELLAECSKAKCALVTNKPVEFTERILIDLGVRDYFDLVFGGDSLPVRKPDPGPMLEAAALARASASDSAVVGDGWQDIQAGRAAGMFTIGIATDQDQHRVLSEAGADIIFPGAGELAAYLKQLGRS